MCAVYRIDGNRTIFISGASLIAPGVVLTAAHFIL
jgi:hypothetical protein